MRRPGLRVVRQPFAPLLVLLTSLFLPAYLQGDAKPVKRILILNEVGPSYPIIKLIDQGIRTGLEDSPYRLEFYHEYFDTVLFPEPAAQTRFHDFYIRKYRNRTPDVVITVGPAPLKFMIETHKRFFPDVPVVFCLPNGLVPSSPSLDSNFTGVETDFAASETLDAALRLKPDTAHVVVIGGVTGYDKQREAIVRQQLNRYAKRLDISYVTDLAMPVLLEYLGHLPKHTVVLVTGIGQDAAGTRFTSDETGPMISAAANAPVFSLTDINVGHGEVGGDLADLTKHGMLAAQLALRILAGQKPKDIARVRGAITYIFDWKAIQRWRFKERDLPPTSIILNRPPSFWKLYLDYVIAGFLALCVQTLVIIALLWQRARRRQTEASLREGEERFRLVANTAPVEIWMSGADKKFTYFNKRWLDFRGRLFQQELGNGWIEGVHRDDIEAFLHAYSSAFERHEPLRIEFRLRRHDGAYRWIFDYGVPRFNADGSFAGYIGSCVDVTERKQAEEALSSVSRRLIEAQEEERAWIARELHDDINQRLALLAVNLEALSQSVSTSDIQTRCRADQYAKELGNLGADIQALSHRLHSSKLEYLGLAAASAAFCKEVSERQNVAIDFQSKNVSTSLANETSVCLFRVLQESLQNAIKHSGSREFRVSLNGSTGGVELIVHDSGVGFDPDAGINAQGLGLTSMKERLKLVNGQLCIHSRQQHGTTIHARVPVSPTATSSEVEQVNTLLHESRHVSA